MQTPSTPANLWRRTWPEPRASRCVKRRRRRPARRPRAPVTRRSCRRLHRAARPLRRAAAGGQQVRSAMTASERILSPCASLGQRVAVCSRSFTMLARQEACTCVAWKLEEVPAQHLPSRQAALGRDIKVAWWSGEGRSSRIQCFSRTACHCAAADCRAAACGAAEASHQCGDVPLPIHATFPSSPSARPAKVLWWRTRCDRSIPSHSFCCCGMRMR